MKNIIFSFAAVLATSFALCADSNTDYRKMALPEPEEKGAAPLGTKWHLDNLDELKRATSDKAIADILSSREKTDELLSNVKGAYLTDPMKAHVISAVTRHVMLPSNASKRKMWADALLSASSSAKDDYVAMFCLDQIRWCGCECNVKAVEEIMAKTKSKMLRSFCQRVVRELKRDCPGL